MASLAYISIPPCATRLEAPTSTTSAPIQRAKKVATPLPNPTSPRTSSSTNSHIPSQNAMNSTASAALSMLLSSTIPTTPGSPAVKEKEKENVRKGPALLSNTESLSIPLTTANFKRFVAKVGPIFWMQDRIEEIILWKRGWRVTGVWMAIYAFFCYFPKMLFALPHMALIALMLATYPYSKPKLKPGETLPIPTDSGSVNWQGNLQGIQNLMGFVADAHDLIQPHIHLLVLNQSHFPSSMSAAEPPTSSYPPLILLCLLLTFLPLVVLIASPIFPARFVCLVGGLLPFVCAHPRIRPLLPTFARLALAVTQTGLVYGARCYVQIRRQTRRYYETWLLWRPRVVETESESDVVDLNDVVDIPPLQTILERIKDNDRLDDRCWNAEMREVELFENERFIPTPSSRIYRQSSISIGAPDSSAGPSSSPPSPTITRASFTKANTVPDPLDPGWSKGNLKSAERKGWTRGRDGWGGVRSSRSSSGSSDHRTSFAEEHNHVQREAMDNGRDHEAEGFVSSNLTFGLVPGWAFVETEGWRRDLARKWVSESGTGEDVVVDPEADGWVYTNDAWVCARGEPYTGSVTRRRRWVRRVWFDGVGEVKEAGEAGEIK